VACRVDGPALVEIVNRTDSDINVTIVIDGVPVTLLMTANETAVIAVISYIEYEPSDSYSVNAATLTGQPVEPRCD